MRSMTALIIAEASFGFKLHLTNENKVPLGFPHLLYIGSSQHQYGRRNDQCKITQRGEVELKSRQKCKQKNHACPKDEQEIQIALAPGFGVCAHRIL